MLNPAKPSRFLLLPCLLLLVLLAAFPARAYDLKGKAKEFADALKTKLNETEDRLVHDARAFIDELNRQWRDEDQRIEKEVAESSDWKKAKREGQKEKRDLSRDFRQRARVHADELELEINRFAQEREREAEELFAEMQKEIEEFKKTKEFAAARRDLNDAKQDVREIIRKWKQKLRELRPTNLKFE
jgi:hypothetical protein